MLSTNFEQNFGARKLVIIDIQRLIGKRIKKEELHKRFIMHINYTKSI